MLRQRGQRYAAEDLSVAAFGDIRGEALDPPQAVIVALAATPTAAAGGTPIVPVVEMDRAAATEATHPTASRSPKLCL